MTTLLVLPILIPLVTAVVLLILWRQRSLQRAVNLVGAAALLLAALALLFVIRAEGVQSVQMGSWQAPFGISLVADLFSASMVLIAAVLGAAVAVYSLQDIDARRESFFYYPLLHILLMGINGAFLTGDIFNLYVWFEVMLMSSFVLLALGGEPRQLEGAIKYVTLNLLASALFLAGVGILYGAAGTLNMADLAVKLQQVDSPGVVTALSMLFFVAFGIKAAVFPLFFWLPASYHTPPVAVSAIFGGLLTKVGVYAMFRVFTLLFNQDAATSAALILPIAALTMVVGVLGAAAQQDFRRLLAFHIISQIGYMIMGLGLALAMWESRPEVAALALGGAIFYIVHNIVAKSNLFLVSGVTYRMQGTFALNRLGGLYRDAPLISTLFLISAFGLAGVPPFSGFFGKLTLVKAGLAAEQYLIVAVALIVGLLTLFSMTKIWVHAFWKPAPDEHPEDGVHATHRPPEQSEGRGLILLIAPVIALAALTIVLGVGAHFFIELAVDAAEQLLERDGYIRAVLGEDAL